METCKQECVQPSGPHSVDQPPYYLLALIAVGFLFANMTLVGLGRPVGVWNATLWAGLVSEAALAALWTCVGSESRSRRVGVTALLWVLGGLTYLTGSYLMPQWRSVWSDHGWQALFVGAVHPNAPVSAGITVALYELLLGLTFIGTLRIHRWVTGQVLCFRRMPGMSAAPIQFTLRQILLASVLMVFGATWCTQLFDPEIQRSPWLFVSTMPLVATYVVLSAVLTVISVECVLSQHRRGVLMVVGVVAIPICAGVTAILLQTTRGARGSLGVAFFESVVFFSTFGVILVFVLHAARRMGFLLTRMPSEVKNDGRGHGW